MSDRDCGRRVNGQEERNLATKQLTKENSRANSSSRVYYYGGATVPFVWETCPGTPKHSLFSNSSSSSPPPPPPLTPPPSYFSSSGNLSSTQRVHNKQKTHFLATLFHLRKSNINTVKEGRHVSRPSFSWSSTSTSTSSSVSSSSSSLYSVSSSSKKEGFHRRRYSLSCSRSPVPYVKDDGDEVMEEEEEEIRSCSSPTSTLCYGSRGGNRGFEGLKRALFSLRVDRCSSRVSNGFGSNSN